MFTCITSSKWARIRPNAVRPLDFGERGAEIAGAFFEKPPAPIEKSAETRTLATGHTTKAHGPCEIRDCWRGRPIGANVAATGNAVCAFDLSEAALKRVTDGGGTLAKSIAEAVKDTEFIITICSGVCDFALIATTWHDG